MHGFAIVISQYDTRHSSNIHDGLAGPSISCETHQIMKAWSGKKSSQCQYCTFRIVMVRVGVGFICFLLISLTHSFGLSSTCFCCPYPHLDYSQFYSGHHYLLYASPLQHTLLPCSRSEFFPQSHSDPPTLLYNKLFKTLFKVVWICSLDPVYA